MADNSGARVTHGSVGTTAETSWLTEPVNSVTVQNHHATQVLYVRVFTSNTSAAAAKALADATDAVADADENFRIRPAGDPETVFNSPRQTYVALSVIASGATTPYEVAGGYSANIGRT
jgi:hypothetical protein